MNITHDDMIPDKIWAATPNLKWAVVDKEYSKWDTVKEKVLMQELIERTSGESKWVEIRTE